MSDLHAWLIIVGSMCRVTAFFMGAMALNHAITHGLNADRIPWPVRLVLYFCGVALALSAMASMFRVAGLSWAPVYREMTHIGVSLSVVSVSVLVMLCPAHPCGSFARRASFMASMRTNGAGHGQSAIVS